MPITAIPDQYLSEKLSAMQRQISELARALGRPSDQIRDLNDNVVQMLPGADYPVWGNKDHDVSLIMANGAVAVGDATGREARPISAETFYGPVTGDTHGVHHGNVGVNGSEFYIHYGDLHGNSYGFHYGPVGDGTTQNQINATDVYANHIYSEIGVPGQFWNAYVTVRGRCLAEVGQPGGPFFTTFGDVGNGSNFFNIFGTIHAPSERGLKVDEESFDGGAIVDAVPSTQWRWDPLVQHDDGELHAGPMVDDVALAAPWLVRKPDDAEGARMLSDRDLIGVLWSALRDARERISILELKAQRD